MPFASTWSNHALCLHLVSCMPNVADVSGWIIHFWFSLKFIYKHSRWYFSRFLLILFFFMKAISTNANPDYISDCKTNSTKYIINIILRQILNRNQISIPFKVSRLSYFSRISICSVILSDSFHNTCLRILLHNLYIYMWLHVKNFLSLVIWTDFHLDKPTDPSSQKCMSILHEHGLTQHANEPTHTLGPILDVVHIYV